MAFSVIGRRFYCAHCNIKILLTLLPVVIIVNVFLYILLFSKSAVVVVQFDDIPNNLVPDPGNLKILNSSKSAKACDVFSKTFSGELMCPEQPATDEMLESIKSKYGIKPGGVWKPESCITPYRVAIIIPYRDRPQNLRDFLAYMHPFLVYQELEYRIVVVEQAPGRPFNRAKLFNVGFQETEKIGNTPCYIFHDVDLIPQNAKNIYACTGLVRHMSANIDVFEYKVPYDSIIGGAVAIRKSQFVDINGFSNTFFGWGGEDDDFYNRITKDSNKICRYAPDVSQYVMLSHKKQKPSTDRYYFLMTGKDRYCTDGLNSLKYTVLKLEKTPLYTRILVDL
uniref:Beta-1,4-N-acetylgalactosaminyltransferase n=1 Tax=Lygus hesperus TaxID=30085 RepID=A0A0A9W4Z7_LYGHE